MALHGRGFKDVRPLAGGIEAWVKRCLPVTTNVETLTAPEHAAFVLHEIFHYSGARAARLLRTSVADVDRLLKSAKQRAERAYAEGMLLIHHRDSLVPQESIPNIPPRP
jgi:3-mercaptopyruvate sulfurtransferase SseA